MLKIRRLSINSSLVIFFLIQTPLILCGQAQDSIAITKGRKASQTERPAKVYMPGKAAMYSALFPGGGQVYNRRYWKLPLVYGGAFGLLSLSGQRHQDYLDFRRSLQSRQNPGLGLPDPYPFLRDETVNANIQSARRDRDFYIILTFMLYALQIVDATVDAHLREFDIDDSLALRIEPYRSNSTDFAGAIPSIGLRLALRLK